MDIRSVCSFYSGSFMRFLFHVAYSQSIHRMYQEQLLEENIFEKLDKIINGSTSESVRVCDYCFVRFCCEVYECALCAL